MSQNMFGCRGLGSGCLRLCVSRQLNKFSTPVCGACHCCIHGLSKITMAVVRNKEKMMQTVHLVFSLSHSQDFVDFISQSVGDYCLSSTMYVCMTLIVQSIHNVEGISLFTPISLVYARSLNNLDVISAGQKEVSDQRETFIQQWTNHG